MREFRQRQKIKKTMYSLPITIFLLFLLFLVLKGTWNAYDKVRISRNALNESKAKQEQVLEKQKKIEGELEHLKTDSGIEEAVRVQFNVSKQGEHTVVIVDEEKEEIIVPEEKTLWQNMTSWFRD